MKFKKILSISLALTMAFTATINSSVASFAEDIQETDEGQSFTLSLLFNEPLAQSEEDSDEYAIAPMWAGKKHADMLEDIINKYGTKEFKNNLSEIKTGAIEADSLMHAKDNNGTYPFVYLHGRDNYVATLRFLKKFAKRLGKGDSLETAKSTALATLSKLSTNQQTSMKTAAGNLVNCIKEKHKGYSASKKKCYVIGLACHLIGDTFAHRMIVPNVTSFEKSDFKNSSITTFNEATLKEIAKHSGNKMEDKYRNWQCFAKTVELGVMEFRDIKNYTKTKTNSKYEDNISFYVKRYNNTVDVLGDFIDTFSDDFDPSIFIPTYGLKLNNLYGYINDTGYDALYYYTKSEWKKFSTLEEV